MDQWFPPVGTLTGDRVRSPGTCLTGKGTYSLSVPRKHPACRRIFIKQACPPPGQEGYVNAQEQNVKISSEENTGNPGCLTAFAAHRSGHSSPCTRAAPLSSVACSLLHLLVVCEINTQCALWEDNGRLQRTKSRLASRPRQEQAGCLGHMMAIGGGSGASESIIASPAMASSPWRGLALSLKRRDGDTASRRSLLL